MPKQLPILIVFLLFTFHFSLITSVHARTTPNDIYNAQKQAYESKLKNYSLSNVQKLENMSQAVADLNKKITSNWEENCLRQGEILEEYIRRAGIEEKKLTDGKTRNLSDKIENARYWLTYAHEAVAYQAANKYVINLTSEANIKGDINSEISQLSADLNILKSKVSKSQQLIEKLVSE